MFDQYTLIAYTATHCNTLQHTAPHCTTLQHTATHCSHVAAAAAAIAFAAGDDAPSSGIAIDVSCIQTP